MSTKGGKGKLKRNSAPWELPLAVWVLSHACHSWAFWFTEMNLLVNLLLFNSVDIKEILTLLYFQKCLQRGYKCILVCPNVYDLNIQNSLPFVNVRYDSMLCRFDFCNWDKMAHACTDFNINLALFLPIVGFIKALPLGIFGFSFQVKPVLISTQRACLAAAGPDAALLDTLSDSSLGTWSGEFWNV